MRLRTVKCGNCGYAAQLRGGATTVACSQCGSTIDVSAVLGTEADHARWYPDPTPLRLGMKATFDGREYELTGRLVQEMHEEGVPYRWQEYELIAGDGSCLFLEFDEGRWKLMRTFTPATPNCPLEAMVMRTGHRLSLDGTTASVTQVSRATTVFVQGELTFAAEAGDVVDYLDAQSWKQCYTVEWTADEIEFYRGSFLSEREVMAAFRLKEQLAALDAHENQRTAQRFFASMCLVFAVLAFIAGSSSRSGGALISHNQVPITSVPPEGIRFGPITLDPSMRVHRLIVNASMTQASAWVAGVMEAADGTELIGSQGDFWDESGYDEGYYHEWSLSAQSDFLVQNPGPYYVRLYTERDSLYGSLYNCGYELRGRVTHGPYLMTYGGLALALAIIFFCFGYQEQLAAAVKAAAESRDDDDD